MESVDVIVTCKNNETIIADCLQSVFDLSFLPSAVFLCDDGSNDRTCQIVEEKYPTVNILKLNQMPAANRNEALKRAQAKYIVFLDSDARLTKDWVKNMVGLMESDNRIGIAGGKILFNEDTIQSAGGIIKRRGTCYDRGIGEPRERYAQSEHVAFICSATMMVRREMLEEIGAFEPYYGYGAEDADLGIRANLAGWSVVYSPHEISYHEGERTVRDALGEKGMAYLRKRNLIFMWLANFQVFSLVKYSPLHLGEFLYELIFNPYRLGTLKSYWAVLRDSPYLMKVRRSNQTRRRVGDREFFRKVWATTDD